MDLAVLPEESGVYITPSEVIEHLFCPRFSYFMHCLGIAQHEEQRYKVLKGRDIHKEREKINRNYLRKKIGCVEKDIDVWLSSPRYHLKGIVDEVLELDDGTLAPLDYKFAEYNERIYQTYKMQSAIYGLLIKENYGKEVRRGYIIYTRSKNKLIELRFSESDFQQIARITEEMLRIIQRGFFPKKTRYLTRCIDCCYKNICV
jgi:CRISPR-associated exonuclease Cas4